MSGTSADPGSAAEPRQRRRWAFLITPSWIAVILAVFAFAAACFFVLAPWQFHRNDERSAQNAAITAAVTAPAVPVDQLLTTTVQPPESGTWRVVTATGRFDPSRQVLVRLRQDSSGQPASEVVLPFHLASGEWLLVDRGYVSFTDVRDGVPIAEPPAGQVTITGRAQAEQVDPANRAPVVVDGHTQAYAIDVAAVDPSGSQPFLDGYIQLTASSPAVLTPIDVPQTDAGPFLSYALQWSAFGVIALIGLAVFIIREITSPRDDEDAATIAEGLPAPGVPVGAGQERRRRSRDGFDRSQLWDDQDRS